MVNTKNSKDIFEKLITEIKDEREHGEQSLENVLKEMDDDIYKSMITNQVLLFIVSNLWEKVYGKPLTSEQLVAIQEAVLNQARKASGKKEM